MAKKHTYATKITWTGNTGRGTETYMAYDRDFTMSAPLKQDFMGSADPVFRGDPEKYNPEELFIASLSSCHMLWYLHLCADNDILVHDYQDNVTSEMDEFEDGSGKFKFITLHPVITIEDADDIEKAKSLHKDAHQKCFIANTINCKVNIEPEVVTR